MTFLNFGILRFLAIDTKQVPDLANFDVYDRMSAEQKDRAMWATIEHIALGKPLRHNGAAHQREEEDGGNVCKVKAKLSTPGTGKFKIEEPILGAKTAQERTMLSEPGIKRKISTCPAKLFWDTLSAIPQFWPH